MTVEVFFDLLIEELKSNEDLQGYYRFLNNESLFEFRKAYYIQRLQYIINQIKDGNARIFDIGCGYGTTGFFLALNGFNVYGTTLEYYYEQISNRFDYWSKFGPLDTFTVAYENLFDDAPVPGSFDVVIVQDVLHHLEPLDSALSIIQNALTPNGIMIACEENGNNLMNTTRLFLKRGNKRVIEFYDEKLEKKILLGNENIRSLKLWSKELEKQNLRINEDSVEYVRLFPPFKYKKNKPDNIIAREQKIWKRNSLLREFFFHGVNFTVSKTKSII